MTTFRKPITVAAAALTLSAAALSATPSSAYYFVHPWGYHGSYHAFGYRPAFIVAPTLCPPGTHAGYLGRHCWSNR
jgi:hypothetical protein